MASEVNLSLQLWPLPGKIGKRHKTPMSKHVSTPPSLTASEKCFFSIYWVPTAAASRRRLPLSHQAPTERSHRIRLRTASSSSKRSKKPYKNVIQASAAFNCMKQKENRTFDDFLKRPAKANCKMRLWRENRTARWRPLHSRDKR